MKRSFSILSLLLLFAPQGLALLEEPLVAFSSSNASLLEITDVNIVYSTDDPVGVRIAAESLVSDLEQITGRVRDLVAWDELPSNGTLANAIIVGSIGSRLVQNLVDEGVLEVDALEDKWESFMTALVKNPIPQIDRALIIVGSDKRGTIFGVHTLAEQCGQSPCVSSDPPVMSLN